MHSLPNLSVLLSFAIAAASSESAWTVNPPQGPPAPWPPVMVTTATVDKTWIFTCPAPPTIYINVTEYVPVTATASYTLPTTIYQTIISTTTQMVPVTTPTTATLTATEIISIYESTSVGEGITICPTRLVNPSYTAAGPYPTDWTWGCPPGWLCKPILDHCNFEAGLPDRNFLCSPNECIPAEALPAILPTWDATIYGNSTPDTNPALGISAIDSFFNMNPLQFGLTYEIFSFSEVFTYTTTILLPPSPTMAARQAQTSIPGACYPWCNNCLLEAQSNGKTSALCVPGSAFEVSLNQCEQCIIYHKNDDTASFVQLAPQFQQFLDYCEQFSTIVISTTVTATTTNTVGSTYSIVTGTIATTVTPKSPTAASSLSTTQSRPTSVVTVVASTATVTTISATSTTARSPNSTTIATPPAPVSSQQPYTTTSTGVTTSYSHTTISGSAWNSITIIMPVGNSTTTIYGSTMSYENATLVLPTSPTTISYTTTMTITPGTQVSAQATTTTVKPSGSAATISPATFNSSASALRFSPRADGLQLTTLTLVLLTIAMLML